MCEQYICTFSMCPNRLSSRFWKHPSFEHVTQPQWTLEDDVNVNFSAEIEQNDEHFHQIIPPRHGSEKEFEI